MEQHAGTQGPLITAALAYAARGWRVFPCHSIEDGRCTCPAGAACTSAGKHPRTVHGCSAASRDAMRIRRWWLRWPQANIGIATGIDSNLAVLDIDPQHGGDDTFLDLTTREGPIPETVESLTGGGGRHLLFRYPAEGTVRNSSGLLGAGLDIRGEGGYIIAPPSRHLSGRVYAWELSHHPQEHQLAEWPARFATPGMFPWRRATRLFTLPLRIAAGARNETLFKLGCSLRGQGMREDEIRTLLHEANTVRCHPALPAPEVEAIVAQVLKYPEGPSGPDMATAEDPPRQTDVPEIRLTAQLADMADHLEAAVVALPGPVLYQRAHRLCQILPAGPPPAWLARPAESPIMVDTSVVRVRELASQAARWMKFDRRARTWQQVLPPKDVCETLAARGVWSVPRLEGMLSAPTILPDGRVLQTPGYDAASGLYCDFGAQVFPPVPEAPTREDAIAALDLLYQPFVDFPFTADCHRAATIAGVLTLVARFAIPGCVPAFVVRAHARGTGKGLLVNTIALIATGRTAPTWTQTTDDAEEAKRLLTIAMAGDACMHIDNIVKPFGSAKLDSAITAATIKDRVLGANTQHEAPWNTVIFASGNNVTFAGDMARRVMPIDLSSPVEHPEARSDFAHSPLLPWVVQERPRLVSAALTVLRAFLLLDCPRAPGLAEYGSFEAWSHLIRHCLVWCGWPDPNESRAGLEEQSDPSYELLATLLTCWGVCYPDGQARTLKTILQDIEVRKIADPGAIVPANAWNELFDAFAAYDARFDGKRLDAKRIGHALRSIEGRVLDGARLTKILDTHAKVMRWRREELR